MSSQLKADAKKDELKLFSIEFCDFLLKVMFVGVQRFIFGYLTLTRNVVNLHTSGHDYH